MPAEDLLRKIREVLFRHLFFSISVPTLIEDASDREPRIWRVLDLITARFIGIQTCS